MYLQKSWRYTDQQPQLEWMRQNILKKRKLYGENCPFVTGDSKDFIRTISIQAFFMYIFL